MQSSNIIQLDTSLQNQPLPRRVLAVGMADYDLSCLTAICEVMSVADETVALAESELAIREGRPFAVVIVNCVGASHHGMCGTMSPLWRSDPAVQGIFCRSSCEGNCHEFSSCMHESDRCLIVSSIPDPGMFRQMVGVMVSKSLSERGLRRANEELIGLTSRQSVAIANANADLISLNRKLESAKDAAEAANRAKSAFLATMSHEIRTPMTAILGYADFLLEEGDIRQAPRDRIEAINTIVRNGRHLVQLINDILDLSKIEANRVDVERIECRPVAIINDVMALMRGRAEEKQLKLEATTAGCLPELIQSDPTRLRQILVNVIGNAIKFTERGHVRVCARYLVENQRPMLEFTISDTGIGMNAEQVSRLFQPFSQADMSMTRRYGGTGLGLCISQRFAEMLGGRIEVSSVAGEGTTFRVLVTTGDIHFLPVATPQATAVAQEDPYAVAEARRLQMKFTGRVLVAEDGVDNQRLFAHLLKKAGAVVTVVGDGQQAYDEVVASETRGEPYDVVLMDMQMPVLDGYAATRRLRTVGYELPVIALTAFAMTGDRQKCLDAGCTDYLTKPIDRTVFLPMVAHYAEQSIQGRSTSPRA